MNPVTKFLTLLVAASLLAACAMRSAVPQTSSLAYSHVLAPEATKQYLYVVNEGSGYITIYGAGTTKPERKINLNHQSGGPVLFDSNGNLYTNGLGIYVFAPGGKTPKYTITSTKYFWGDLALDESANLYATASQQLAQCQPKNTVVEFKAGTSQILRKITKGASNASSLIFDESGNLYVANAPCTSGPDSVGVYKPGASTPWYTISKGIDYPAALAVDSLETLYVANMNNGTVTEYASGKSAPTETVVIAGPVALAIDGKNNLYVANGVSVSAYSPSSTKPFLTITKGFTSLCNAGRMAFDASDDLYVATGLSNTNCPVLAYHPGAKSPFLTIKNGLSAPADLGFSTHS